MSDAPVSPTAAVLDALDLTPDPTVPDQFSGHSLPQPNGRVFGGQVLAQALLAAGRTVDADRLPHSLHGYFLRAGVVTEPISFAVERLRDGRSFTARRTHALQGGAPILSLIASFQTEQDGVDYADEMPDGVPAPEDVPSALDLLGTIDHPAAKFWAQESAFDVRHVDGSIYLGRAAEVTGRQQVWFRARDPLPDDRLLHRALLAYACDQVMLEPVLRRSGRSWVTPGMSIASLDHAMWWHRDARVDDWLLYVQTSPSAQGGRGLGAARVFTRDGTLVASIAQEGMVRFPD
ncbi:acyl-CoA thioesterase II [Cellulomonas sp. H30R-01]|uniref:Acyl-CoA thioesterase 2 n=1 Tax=Cellulomonas algicola TaxID=2071633 RepID=A0A401V525_9CELL|nr:MULTISPECIES: acyl-CoA thioesterase II [Cellulomonas]QHT55292.1 acyl-CoA thioesterase II [Cellulomonas sp. H30R-01]GCD22015.1 acyl-CoA thioesterase II [Cellulomonas algicola]